MAEVAITPGPRNSIPEATFLSNDEAVGTIEGSSPPVAAITPGVTPYTPPRFLVNSSGGKMLNSSGEALIVG